MNEIKPYKLSISNDEIEDLKRRLANTRLPDQAPGEPWKTGTDLEWFKKLLDYWKLNFDWKKSESELNDFPQYKTKISDIDLHFICCEACIFQRLCHQTSAMQ